MNRRERLKKMLSRSGMMAAGTLVVGLIIERINKPDHLGFVLPIAAAGAYIFAWVADSKSTEVILGNKNLIELNPLVPPHPSKKDLYTPARMTIEATGLVLSISQPEFGIGFATLRTVMAINNLRLRDSGSSPE